MGPLSGKWEEIQEQLRKMGEETWIKIGIVAVVCVFLLLLLTSPWWHEIIEKHEALAVKSLHGIHALGVRYYGEHADKGFNCRLVYAGDDRLAEAVGGTASGYVYTGDTGGTEKKLKAQHEG